MDNDTQLTTSNGPPVRILVVDDEPQIRNLLSQHLAKQGYFVSTAANGEEAFELFSKTPYDIVLTDMNMPRVDGLALIRKIKEMQHNVDIIAMTGFAQTYEYTRVIEAGAADFIYKPFEGDELNAKLKRVIRDRREKAKLAEKLLKDSLTGAYNRYGMEQIAPKEIARATRAKYPLSMFFIDIDGFKQFNDTYGHIAGDIFLKKFVNAVKTVVRKNLDFLFRYGGDEFILLVTNAQRELVEEIAHRILSEYSKITPRAKSISIGVVFVNFREKIPVPGLKDLIHLADRAMYEAKTEGKTLVIKVFK